MKRLIIAFIACIMSLAASAQTQTTWIHHGLYPLSQSGGFIELSDGNLVVRESVFDEEGQDIGYNLYKITTQGELLDSLFIENHNIDILQPMLRDPDNTNSNIMTSFYKEGDVNYYKAIYFNDNLEITNEIVTEYYDNCKVPDFFFIDSNSDLICWSLLQNRDLEFCLVKMRLDGTLISQSNPITSSASWFLDEPIFEISSEPLRYGYMTCLDMELVFDIFDADLNLLLTHNITKIRDWNVDNMYYNNAWGCGNGSFLVTTEGAKLVGTQMHRQLMLVKYSQDFDIEAVYDIGNTMVATNLPKYECQNRNLCVTDNNIYLVWQEKKARSDKASIQTLFVTCLDMNMNLVWEETSLSVLNHGMIANYGLIPLSNGGMALSGWLSDELAWYDSNVVYAVMFDNHLSTTEIESAAGDVICYPNPTTGIINVTGENIVNIEVVNIMGQTMLKKDCDGSEANVDISSLTPGIYLIKALTSDGTEFSERVVKE